MPRRPGRPRGRSPCPALFPISSPAYFGGPQTGLGSLITSAAANSGYAAAWAYVVGAIVVGLVFYLATLGLERAVSRGRVA
jgi:NitT/TauT family transport system permease protein